MRPDPLLQLGRIGPDPAKDDRVINRDAAVLQHEREVAIADREHQIPAHGDRLGRELPALERLTQHHRRPSPRPSTGADYAAFRPASTLCNRAAWHGGLFAEGIGIRHARAPMFGSEWYHGLCFVKPDTGIELLGQDGLAVVAPELCVGPVDHADEALQPRLREAAT